MLKALVSVVPNGLVAGAPVLLIDGEMYGPDEVVGYLLIEASEGEEAELRRGGYALARGTDVAPSSYPVFKAPATL